MTIFRTMDTHHDIVENALGDISAMFAVIMSAIKESETLPIPYGTAIAKMYKLISTVQATRMHRKLKAFFKEPSKIDEQSWKQFEKNLGKNKDRFLEDVIDTIERLEDERKAAVLSKAFAAHVENLVNSDDFKFITNVIKITLVDEFEFYFKIIGKYGHPTSENLRTMDRLTVAGLYHRVEKIDHDRARALKELGFSGNPQIEINYEPTKIGKVFANVMNNAIAELKGALAGSVKNTLDQFHTSKRNS